VSFFRPRFPDRPLEPVDFEATFRTRGLKGFQPHHVVGFQDPLFADDPQFWILAGDLIAAAGFTGHIGVVVPDVRDLLCIVDSVDVGVTVTDLILIEATQGDGLAPTTFLTDSQVTLRNRRDQGPNPGFAQRVGLSRIADNTTAGTGQTIISQFRTLTNTTTHIELGHRLYRGENLIVRNSAANIGLTVTMRGRLMKRT
jgi:hypothetical protein